jgi:signal transduction histidine kinase
MERHGRFGKNGPPCMNFNLGIRRHVTRDHSSTRPWFSGLVLGALLLPATLYGVVAWQDRVGVLQQTEQNVQSTAQVLAEHADNVFETHRLIANLVNEHIRGMGWSEIAASRAVHEFLADIIRDQPRVRSLWLVDPAGMVRNSSAMFPIPEISVTDRDYFIALRQRDAGIFIGEVVRGRIFAEDILNVAKRRTSSSGTFDGVVVVSALPSYLTEFWSAIAREPGNATLVRSDGAILARMPAVQTGPSPLRASNLLMQAMDQGKEAGVFRAVSPVDGVERLYGYRKVGEFPIYVGRGINLSAALQTWHDNLLFFGEFFIIVTGGLVSLALIASHRLRQWRQTAIDLRREIGHRERIEGQFWQAQKMEALGRLASESAHDFGNILSVISGSLDILESRPADPKFLALARSAAERGTKLIGTMLTFGRQQPLRREVFDVNAVLAGIDSLLHQAVGSRIKLDLEPAIAPCWIMTDRNQLELAVLNIVMNARDAMPQGGAVTVTTKTLHLTGDPDGLVGDYAAVEIKDTGPGMPPDIQARVLEPFFTTKGAGKGTGLGLSMVYGFSKQAGGTVTIESVVERGTTVVIYLPLSQADDGGMASAKTESAASG